MPGMLFPSRRINYLPHNIFMSETDLYLACFLSLALSRARASLLFCGIFHVSTGVMPAMTLWAFEMGHSFSDLLTCGARTRWRDDGRKTRKCVYYLSVHCFILLRKIRSAFVPFVRFIALASHDTKSIFVSRVSHCICFLSFFIYHCLIAHQQRMKISKL